MSLMPDLSLSTLRTMLQSLLRIRRVEEAIESRYPEDEIKTAIHLSIGQEATAVGSCTALGREDLIFTSHRGHAAYLAKGGSLPAMISELYGRANGCVGSRGGSMHLIDRAAGVAGSSAICAGTVPMATGAGLTSQLRGERWVSVVYFGDGASEEGVVWESLNFAALKKLPVLFLCENNFYSVCSALNKRQPPSEIHQKARAFGVESVAVDGTNVLEVYEATRAAVGRARDGGGPSFIESRAYRWRSHGGVGEDTHLGYRSAEELETWKKRCPLESFYQLLVETGAADEAARFAMEEEIRREIEAAFYQARTSPLAAPEEFARHVYADGH